MTTQIPLPLHFPARSTFDQFWPGGNEQLVHNLRATACGGAEPLLFLWGPAASGKSHLLQAACHLAHQHGRSISYLPLKDLLAQGAEIFDGLGYRQLVCLDDIDSALGDCRSEQGLFRLYNELRDAGGGLVVSASVPPAELPARLPDLRSRLTWGIVFRINPLNEENTLAAIQLQARELGFEMPPRVGRFLMHHCRRDFASLRRLLERLDSATLAAQRKLTIPFIKQFLEQEA